MPASLKKKFAAVLQRAGFHPTAFAGEQLFAALETDDAKTIEAILTKNPAAINACGVPTKGQTFGRSMPVFEAAVEGLKYKSAATMLRLFPALLTQDFSEDRNFPGRTILIQRAINGESEKEISFLCGHDVDTKACDSRGMTALHFAAGRGQIGMARILMAFKADVNAVNDRGETPLMYAGNTLDPSLAQALVDMGADIDKTDNEGRNATMRAIRSSGLHAAATLIKLGGTVDFTDRAVDTARRVATHEGEFDFLEALAAHAITHAGKKAAAVLQGIDAACGKGLAADITVRPIQLKAKASRNV